MKNDTPKTPEYVRRNIYTYQKKNRRIVLRIDEEDYNRFVQKYGEGYSFNGYVRELLDRALLYPVFGTYQYPSTGILKSCVFSKEYEERLKELFKEQCALDSKFPLTKYVQFLIRQDLYGDNNL